eukprot:SAG22_NODE_17_length_32684_cov_34.234095_7_plen_189_part_00
MVGSTGGGEDCSTEYDGGQYCYEWSYKACGSSSSGSSVATHPAANPDPGTEELASGHPASSSSVDYAGAADLAVDGDKNNVFSGSSCTHTTESELTPWWQVDLGSIHRVGQVNIYHRTDCCVARLVGTEVVVSSTTSYADGHVCEALDEAGAQPEIVLCGGTSGRYVTVARQTTRSDAELAAEMRGQA